MNGKLPTPYYTVTMFEYDCMHNEPKISVITVVYNNRKYIEGCMKSVFEQSYKNIEYIVIDGASTDGTTEIVAKYRDSIDIFISERDNGIASAMNKGISNASGEYLMFLHADDYFYNEHSLAEAVKFLVTRPDILLCDILFGKDLKRKTSRGLDWKSNFKTGVWHQGSFCKKALFDKYGKFDEDIKITMDFDLFLRFYKNGINADKSSVVLTVMRDTGVSSQTDWKSLKTRFLDERKVMRKNSSSLFHRFFIDCYFYSYIAYRKITQIKRVK